MADRKLKIDIRRGKILEHLRKNGKVSVTELSQELGATADFILRKKVVP